MNRFASFLSASAMTALAFGVGSSAAFATSTPAAPQAIEQTLASVKAEKFIVVELQSLQKDDPVLARFDKLTQESPEARKLQAAIITNKPLLQALQKEQVEVTNIVGAEAAADGGITLYLR